MVNKEQRKELKQKIRVIFQFENENLDLGLNREELINNIRKQLELISKKERRKIEQELKGISSKNGTKKYFEAVESCDCQGGETLKQHFAKEIKIFNDLDEEIYNHLLSYVNLIYSLGNA